MPEDQPDGVIRITFKDVTLAMSILESSWLAEKIKMEIRKVENQKGDEK